MPHKRFQEEISNLTQKASTAIFASIDENDTIHIRILGNEIEALALSAKMLDHANKLSQQEPEALAPQGEILSDTLML